MQLFILIALIFLSGRSDAKSILREVKPVLENFGGEQVKEMMDNAEKLSEMLSVVQTIAAATKNTESPASPFSAAPSPELALAPIKSLAPEPIFTALKECIAI